MIYRRSAFRAACYSYCSYYYLFVLGSCCSRDCALLLPSSSASANPWTKHIIDQKYSSALAFPFTEKTLSSSFIRRRHMSSSSSATMEEYRFVASNFRAVQERVNSAAANHGSSSSSSVRLVAVSKTKPLDAMKIAYDAGCRVFGENYVQEMIGKMEQWKNDDDDNNDNDNNNLQSDKPSSNIQWHFIGSLQSNKCNGLVKAIVSYSDLSRCTIETVSSIKLADKLNSAVQTYYATNPSDDDNNNDPSKQRLKVFVQVNTSREDTKSGVTEPEQVIELCRHIVETCPHLELRGLMTIGAAGDANDFEKLAHCRDQVLTALLPTQLVLPECFELSMGMSGDFEEAIQAGSTNVRVGSTIFGERDYSKK